MPALRPDFTPTSARDYPDAFIAQHIEEERRQVSLLGEIRELVFGAQDGLVSTLAVVATVAGASSDNLAVLVAGFAAALAGVFSMAIGEYMGSKSQAEIFAHQIADEREEIADRPFEAEAEVAYLFREEGMPDEDAWQVAGIIARSPDSLLATMVSKELGLAHDEQDDTAGSPLRGALVMGASFAVGAAFPVAPFIFLEGLPALTVATVLTGLVLFCIGAVKARWTQRFWLWSGLEILALAAVAGVAGYLLGSVLPSLLGYSGVV
jgi:VIT1/CCC1 family predicted Fe2+/Mn2+ transporter